MSKPPRWNLPSLPAGFRDASGLVRIRPPIEVVKTPKEVAVRRPVIVASKATASFEDQLHAYTTAKELLEHALEPEWVRVVGVAELTRESVIEAVASMPFEAAMRYIASLQKEVYFARSDSAHQVALVQALYGDALAGAAATIVRDNPRRALFTEQQLFALQRLLVLHAREDDADDLTPEEYEVLRWILLWVPDTILDPDLALASDDEGEEADLADERWLRFFVGHGGLAIHNSLRHELARAHRMYEVIANSAAARRHENFCPLDRWLRERYGVSFVELQVIGFGLHAGSKIRDPGGPAVLIDADYYAPTSLAGRVDQAFNALAAPREWFRTEYAASGEHPRRAAFETQPFLRRPGLLQRNGKIAVVAPRALEGWLSSTGAYFRFLDLARERGDELRTRFGRFNGFLVERYALHLACVAAPDQRRRAFFAGAGRVFREQTYRVAAGESKTSDVIIDLGQDLVLIEVTAKRVTEKSLVEADANKVMTDLKTMLLDNMKQLGRVIADLDLGAVTFANVEMPHVRRIWPVIVSPEGLFQNPSLWTWLEREGARYFAFDSQELRAKRQPLVLLDLEEYEALMGLVRADGNLIGILEQKTSDQWRERDFQAWLEHEGREEVLVNKDFIGEELKRAFGAMITAMKP